MTNIKRTPRVVAAFVLLASTLFVASTAPFAPIAAAQASDDFTLSKVADVGTEALIGEHVTYTIEASGSQSSGAYLYNLSFRDVLPAGVGFVSADPAPTTVLVGVPAGQTTVIWENISDLPSGSRSSVDVTVDTNPDFAGGATGSTTNPGSGPASRTPPRRLPAPTRSPSPTGTRPRERSPVTSPAQPRRRRRSTSWRCG